MTLNSEIPALKFLLSAPPESPKERFEQIDIVKGIAILLVVAGHAKYPLSLWCNQYAFHMQLFFIIAGFFINLQSSFFSFAVSKIKSLLIPFYCYFAVSIWLTYFLTKAGVPSLGYGNCSDMLSVPSLFIKPFLHNHHIFLSLPLWFVSTLFQVMLLVAITRPLLKFLVSRCIWTISGLIFFLLLSQITVFHAKHLSDSFDAGWATRLIIVYGLVVSGFLLWKLKALWNRTDVLTAATIIYLLLVWNYNPGYTMSWNTYGQGMLPKIFVIVSLTGTAAIFGLANIFKQCPIIRPVLAFCGKKSLHILALHLIWICLISLIVDHIKHNNIASFKFFNWSASVHPGIFFAASILLSLLCCAFFDKTRKMIKNHFSKSSIKQTIASSLFQLAKYFDPRPQDTPAADPQDDKQ